MADGIGMMDGAFFVGRTELLNWLNSTFQLNYTKVEQCCTGAAHCQVIDSIFPGTVQMDKVIWNAKSEYQYVDNFKILQNSFNKNGIKRYVDVQKLVKGKYQDNLEFFQWIKAFFELKKGKLDPDYDPVARRSVSTSAASLGKAIVTAVPSATKPARPSTGAIKTTVITTPASGTVHVTTSSVTVSSSSSVDNGKTEALQAKVNELEALAEEDRVAMENITKERDFYFQKLRDIEVLCQQLAEPKPEIVVEILNIMYSVEEGFEAGGQTEAQ